VTDEHEWSVIVVKTQPAHVRETVVRVYRFLEDLIGVAAIHFVVRDRMQDGVLVSFRLRLESADADATKAAIRRELVHETIVDFAIDPSTSHPLHKFGAWPWQATVQQRGAEKFAQFSEYLSQFSRIVVDMAEHDDFASSERAEMAHVVAWMLGLTECGVLRVKGMKGVDIGYYDRIENTTHPYLTYRYTDTP
jgi:hypothetical protein